MFGYKPILLWTDGLFFIVILLILSALVLVARRPHLRGALNQILRNRRALFAIIILVFYGVIGLLDSMHFQTALPLSEQTAQPIDEESTQTVQYSVEIHSVLDAVLNHLRLDETSYSAPFALNAFDREPIDLPDGTVIRDYPPLIYAGTHLGSAAERIPDIVKTLLKAFIVSIVVFAVLVALINAWRARHQHTSMRASLHAMVHGQTDIPWRFIFSVGGLLLLLVIASSLLAANYHIMGTDKVGEDVFYQSLKSIRTGLIIGSVTTLIMLPFALLFGMMAGYFRGWVDDAIQYIYTTLSSIPGILLIVALVLILQVFVENNPQWFDAAAKRADIRLLALCAILGITSWTSLCRLLRADTLKVRELDYVQAARALGVGHFKILRTHILPNVMYLVIITVALDFSGLVLAEAVLSYVGVGVDPASYSWGNMINQARLELAREPVIWWSLMSAFVFMFVLVLAANLLADALRDAFDVRFKPA